MRFSRRNQSRRGMALVIAMCAVIMLGFLAAAFAAAMKVETRLSINSNNDPRLNWLGQSGVQLASWVLAQEASIPNEPYDSLNQYWAGGNGSAGESNSVLVGLKLDNYPVGEGTVSVKMTDMERLANINTADTPELQQALTLMGVDADSISVIADSIQDWIDNDDMPRIAGAESDYYQGMTPPYNAKNAPIDDMTELLLIKGIREHPEIFWGGSPSNLPPSAIHHKLGFGRAPNQPADYPFGLNDLFTPFSNGKININTANANTLMLVPGMDANMADSILKLRAGPDGADGTEDDTPFQSVNQLVTAGINPTVVAQMTRYCSVRSAVFKVSVTAKIGASTRDFNAILYRNGRNVQVIGFYWIK
jgi:general secretion pathway protein K